MPLSPDRRPGAATAEEDFALPELMDGCCGVHNEPARGSTFWCDLPFGRGAKTGGAWHG